jgi:pimeloyl-ACP methyl ester carboxylesterase
MPAIVRDGVTLYYETAGEGTPLVILHGFMGTLEQNYHWLPHFPDHQVILLDARGHGKSGKPHDPSAYALSERTRDVIAVLDHLGLKKAHFMGYSMGGWIALGLAAAFPKRFYSVVAGGIGPDALSPEPSRHWREAMIEALQGGMENYCRRVEEAEDRTMSKEERARYLAQDHRALIAMLSLEEEPEFGRALAHSDVRLLMFVGKLDMYHDSARELCDGLEHAHFLPIPGRGHGDAAEPQDFLVAEITRFLAAKRPSVATFPHTLGSNPTKSPVDP